MGVLSDEDFELKLLSMNVHRSTVHNKQNMKQTPPPSADEWISKCGMFKRWRDHNKEWSSGMCTVYT